jgi:hypothetical protein
LMISHVHPCPNSWYDYLLVIYNLSQSSTILSTSNCIVTFLNKSNFFRINDLVFIKKGGGGWPSYLRLQTKHKTFYIEVERTFVNNMTALLWKTATL